jgi:hypothetical protein
MRRHTCRNCRSNDETVSYRERTLSLLCAACHVDAVNFTSTRAVANEREDHPETRTWFAPEVGR